jgi:hypothetical protein
MASRIIPISRTLLLTLVVLAGGPSAAEEPKHGAPAAEEANFAEGPGPYSYDCDAAPGTYEHQNIHALGDKLKVAGYVQVLEWRSDKKWAANVSVGLLGASSLSSALQMFVMPWAPKTIQVAVHDSRQAPQERTTFASAPVRDGRIPFEVTLDGSSRFTVALPHVSKSVVTNPIHLTKVQLFCSGAHALFTDVTLSAVEEPQAKPPDSRPAAN